MDIISSSFFLMAFIARGFALKFQNVDFAHTTILHHLKYCQVWLLESIQ